MINGGSGSGKTNVLLDLMNEHNKDLITSIDKIYIYAKDLNEPKYQILIKKCEYAGIKRVD